ncbi:hypothetical protein RJ641_005641 [Dillenia turbinata]|uniref:Uncharacterized protein n=1 Tax=Dillenia turbinata TaxID=194707 RepID=A0AAN8VGD5_9MAGN
MELGRTLNRRPDLSWSGLMDCVYLLNLFIFACAQRSMGHEEFWHFIGAPTADAPRKISGVHKRCWRYIPNSFKAIEKAPTPENHHLFKIVYHE